MSILGVGQNIFSMLMRIICQFLNWQIKLGVLELLS